MHVSPSEFEKDLDVILACFRNEERPTPEQIEAIAKSPTAQRQWRDVANAVLAKTGDDARAIREANAAVAKRTRGGGTKPKKR